jgi:hypothetical protein
VTPRKWVKITDRAPATAESEDSAVLSRLQRFVDYHLSIRGAMFTASQADPMGKHHKGSDHGSTT